MMLAMLAVMLLCQSAKADPVSLTLTNPTQSGTVGSVLTFMASLNNTAAPAAIAAADDFTFNGPVSLALDDSPFLVNFLGQNISAGSTLGPSVAFTVTLGAGTAPGTYNGVFSVFYNSTLGAGQETNVQAFSVTVQPAGAAVPEPTTVALLISGLLGLGLTQRRRRN